ncbi:MAG TPA: 30S ribosomal protein S4e [Candidatus Nanoarchaeia archaeon]|nr:30S ribosomal protein S4e [Candidatus Nanoarchaeia archaeon]
MGKNHLFSISAPKRWLFNRKDHKYITRPLPGSHPLQDSIPLSFLLREILEEAKTMRDVKAILNSGNILVDGVIRKDEKFAVGLMDVIEIPKLNAVYRIVYDLKGRFILANVKKENSNLKLLKIIKKTVISSGKLQVTFHDGKNILFDKFEGKIGDSVLFDLSNKKIAKNLTLEQGSLVYLKDGSHVGKLAKVTDIIQTQDLQKPKVVIEIDGKQYVTLRDYTFVVGKDKPEINLEVKK